MVRAFPEPTPFGSSGIIMKVAVIVGSLRRESITLKIAKAMIELAPAQMDCSMVQIGDLALYNEDLEADVPASWTRFRREVGAADAVLFATPEYNRSLPGGLKNAVDVGSRPQDKSVWKGKPAGVVSVTPYKLGAFGANQHLRQIFVFLDMPAMQQPEAYIGGAGEMFDASGALTNDETRKFLSKFMAAFAKWIETTGKSSAG
jgi:chromate reductase